MVEIVTQFVRWFIVLLAKAQAPWGQDSDKTDAGTPACGPGSLPAGIHGLLPHTNAAPPAVHGTAAPRPSTGSVPEPPPHLYPPGKRSPGSGCALPVLRVCALATGRDALVDPPAANPDSRTQTGELPHGDAWGL